MGGTSHAYLWEAARATSSAPTFYKPLAFGGRALVDGAILCNNPTLVALAEAALLWPGAPVEVLVSLGTGRLVPAREITGCVTARRRLFLAFARLIPALFTPPTQHNTHARRAAAASA